MPTLRRRIATSPIPTRILGAVATAYLRLCLKTTRWSFEGVDALAADIKNGPVLVVIWHERLLLGAAHWPHHLGDLSNLYASSAIGKVGGDVYRRFGLTPVKMSEKKSNAKATRDVLKRARQGISICIAADGPRGPAKVVNEATTGWASALGLPIHCYAYATKRHWRLGSWDKMVWPLPFSHGHFVFHRWDGDVPRKADQQTLAAAAVSLAKTLNDTCDMADAGAAVASHPR